MSLLDRIKQVGQNVVDAGNKTKLKAEIALIDREIRQRKQVFGVDVYECMEIAEKNKQFWSTGNDGSSIRIPYDACKKDVLVIEANKESKQQQIDVLDVRMTNKVPAQNLGDKVRNASSTVKEASSKTKIRGEILLLDREIKARKQMFGIEMYNVIEELELSTNTKWMANDNKDIQSCYEFAKNDITVKETTKKTKVGILENLEAQAAAMAAGANFGVAAEPVNGDGTFTTMTTTQTVDTQVPSTTDASMQSKTGVPTTPTMSSI